MNRMEKLGLLERRKIERLESSREKANQALANIIEEVNQKQSETLQQSLEKVTPAPINITVDTSDIAKAIDGLKFPEPVIKVEAPKVNVVNKIDTPSDPYDSYKRANSSEEGSVTYHGFVNPEGKWFIQKEFEDTDIARSRFAVGEGTFEQAWPKRANFTYKLFSEVKL